MSAYGYQRIFGWAEIYVRFDPENGRRGGGRRVRDLPETGVEEWNIPRACLSAGKG